MWRRRETEAIFYFHKLKAELHLVTLYIGMSTVTCNYTLMFYNESHLWKQRHCVVLINGFDRNEETCLFPLGFRHVIHMKRDMYKSAIILKYDTKLMTSEEERMRLLFSLPCFVVHTLVPSLCLPCQPRQ